MNKKQDHREYARQHASQGIALLAHAVNACNRDDATYRYSKRHLERFMSIAEELVRMIEDGEIIAISHGIKSSASAPTEAPTEAEHDRGFQNFMARLSAKFLVNGSSSRSIANKTKRAK